MSEATTQQPGALRVAEQLRDMSSRFKTPSHELGVCNAAIEELRRQHAKIARLTADNEALREKRHPLTNEQKTAIFHSRAGENDHGVPYLCCYREGFDHIVAAIEAAHGIGASTATSQHADDVAVDAFADAMKAKMARQRAKGYGGWQECPADDLRRMLAEHVAKGDPVDVGNFAMMLFARGERT